MATLLDGTCVRIFNKLYVNVNVNGHVVFIVNKHIMLMFFITTHMMIEQKIYYNISYDMIKSVHSENDFANTCNCLSVWSKADLHYQL